MGLVTGLLTLPLAPVRGTAWIAEQLRAEAERQLDDPQRLRRALEDVQVAYELGEIDLDEYEQAEAQILARLVALEQEPGNTPEEVA
jgi:glycerol dehydrogenase-like iron-containing ADH family enzyme